MNPGARRFEYIHVAGQTGDVAGYGKNGLIVPLIEEAVAGDTARDIGTSDIGNRTQDTLKVLLLE